MVKSLLFIWMVAVVAFFVLWALIALLVRRISEKKEAQKQREETVLEEADAKKAPENAANPE
ncbi:MAG: hypothetical protein J6X40_08135 [Bacteroidales bacterium]|nr:hypothetical protein [Bacteroidales bacterium]